MKITGKERCFTRVRKNAATGIRMFIGRFISEDAARAYDKEALALFGKFASTNFKEVL